MTTVRLHHCRFHQSARALLASRNGPSTYSPMRNYADPLDALHGVPASLRLLVRANAPILTCSNVSVQHHPVDASTGVADNCSSIGRMLRLPEIVWLSESTCDDDARRRLTDSASQRDSPPPPPGLLDSASPPRSSLSPGSAVLKR